MPTLDLCCFSAAFNSRQEAFEPAAAFNCLILHLGRRRHLSSASSRVLQTRRTRAKIVGVRVAAAAAASGRRFVA